MGGMMRFAMAISPVLFLSALLALCPVSLSAQAAAASSPASLPKGFRGISLGMELDQVKKELQSDPLFGYRGDPDVSLLPQTHQYLIECSGASYVRRAYFQFADGRLLTMILVLDSEKLDHYSLFSALSTKYGPPTSLNPQETVWQSDLVRLSLERPLTVKYVDQATFNTLVGKANAPSDLENLSREKFIEQF
jgi:hypothetical protein